MAASKGCRWGARLGEETDQMENFPLVLVQAPRQMSETRRAATNLEQCRGPCLKSATPPIQVRLPYGSIPVLREVVYQTKVETKAGPGSLTACDQLEDNSALPLDKESSCFMKQHKAGAQQLMSGGIAMLLRGMSSFVMGSLSHREGSIYGPKIQYVRFFYLFLFSIFQPSRLESVASPPSLVVDAAGTALVRRANSLHPRSPDRHRNLAAKPHLPCPRPFEPGLWLALVV
ncbi:hypothetical protein VTK26DRAFT_5747 [Humicola hyalothermophila]